ncbi:MAG: hypothetical protein AAB562_01330, partial [Patescibacteria group bacterium]
IAVVDGLKGFPEAINAIFGMGIYFGIQLAMPAVICLSVFFKGFSMGGLLPNFRVAWLKALPVPEAGRRIMIIAQVIVQSSYGSAIPQTHPLTLPFSESNPAPPVF